jgi:VanZ family protein
MNKPKYNIKISILISWLAAFLWMLLIFSLSSQPASQSSELSGNITKVIIEIISKIIPLDIESSTTTDFILQFDHMVRKFAHGSVYFVLAILIMNAFMKSGGEVFRTAACTLIFCIFYAVGDEVHQLFVPGRSGQIKDILIDSIGAIVGIGLYGMISRIKRNIMTN